MNKDFERLLNNLTFSIADIKRHILQKEITGGEMILLVHNLGPFYCALKHILISSMPKELQDHRFLFEIETLEKIFGRSLRPEGEEK